MVDGAAESEKTEWVRTYPWRRDRRLTLPFLGHHARQATHARIDDRERTALAVAYNSQRTVVCGRTGVRTYRAAFI